jgi:hypothetical protein
MPVTITLRCPVPEPTKVQAAIARAMVEVDGEWHVQVGECWDAVGASPIRSWHVELLGSGQVVVFRVEPEDQDPGRLEARFRRSPPITSGFGPRGRS